MIGFKLYRCLDIPAFYLESTAIDVGDYDLYFYARRNGCPDSDVPIGSWVNRAADGYPRVQETTELEFLILTGKTFEASWQESLDDDNKAITKS